MENIDLPSNFFLLHTLFSLHTYWCLEIKSISSKLINNEANRLQCASYIDTIVGNYLPETGRVLFIFAHRFRDI